ncbi:hypothetical protein GIB67_031218 [Kingdonia uniflora]|uniref:riboflavin kinase n=1 Tax=Kingdonia uniflora TaxID=39325 RepID=A0A7J7NKB7_9MAGN|nr:hypothetical protein GIB67_031218 [Kingdonia uniflora]
MLTYTRPGVTAGKSAGMEVVAIPSLPKQSHLYVSADEVVNSLLDLRPENWGLPPFQDWIESTLPIEPLYIGGPIIKGYGRGSKVLGIPTGTTPANFTAATDLVHQTSGPGMNSKHPEVISTTRSTGPVTIVLTPKPPQPESLPPITGSIQTHHHLTTMRLDRGQKEKYQFVDADEDGNVHSADRQNMSGGRALHHPYATQYQDDDYYTDSDFERCRQPKRYGRGSDIEALARALIEQTLDLHLKVQEFNANLSAEGYYSILSDYPSGVYFGWAGLSDRGVYKMVMSIGWNPYFNNSEKTIEPWLLHDFDEDFYGEELRLAIVGYIRPEANFSSLESLIAKIREDGETAEKALDIPLYEGFKDVPFLKGHMQQNGIH